MIFRVNITETDRLNTDHHLSCQIFDQSSGGHIIGFGWAGGSESGSPEMEFFPFPNEITDLDVIITTTTQFQYELEIVE